MARPLDESPMHARRAPSWRAPAACPRNRLTRSLLLLLGLAGAGPCAAASSEFVDSAAHVPALVIIIAVPIGGIVLFWLVHILPETSRLPAPPSAARRDQDALSAARGLRWDSWPLAWLWAFTKPVIHRFIWRCVHTRR